MADNPRYVGAKIQEISEIYHGEIASVGNWLFANVETTLYWPVELQKVRFREQDIFIFPLTVGRFPGIAAKAVNISETEMRRVIMKLLSSMAWVFQHGISVKYWSGGSRASPMGMNGSHNSITQRLQLEYLPDPADQKAQVALGLYREALSLECAPYAFLSFFKILDLSLPKKEIIPWINDNIELLDDRRAKDTIASLKNRERDVGHYLYASGRCAAAHANREPIIDPDDPEDGFRLTQELPILRALSERAIEEIHGVKTNATVYHEHLYELAGWKNIIGVDIVSYLISRLPSPTNKLDILDIDVGILVGTRWKYLSRLSGYDAYLIDGGIGLSFRSKEALVLIDLNLSFADERLKFEIHEDLRFKDDKSPLAAEVAAELNDFMKHYYLNGRLAIWDADNGTLLSRKDAFVPVNVMVNPEGFDSTTEHWRSEAARRANLEQIRFWRVVVVHVCLRWELG